MQARLLINGQLETGSGAPRRHILDRVEITTVAEASAEQVAAAIAAANNAFTGWALTPPRERAALLLAIADAIEPGANTWPDWNPSTAAKPMRRR